MNKPDRRRRKIKAHRDAAALRLRTIESGGLPTCPPTPERLRRGQVSVQPLVQTVELEPGRRDWTGDAPGSFPRQVLMGHARRDLASDVRFRLARFKDLTASQVGAAEQLERDWGLAKLEPRMIADLRSAGVGKGWSDAAMEARHAVIDARDRLHSARCALRRGGEEVLRIVEGVVVHEATADSVGAPVYSAKRDASVYVRALLGIGLNLLADWYAGRMQP